jgi:hypothetical protein
MAEMSIDASHEPMRVRYSRAFRPLSYWLLISVGLLAWDYHRKHAPRTTLTFQVRIEGQTLSNPSTYSATVSQRRIGPGSVVPIGWRKLRVEMPDATFFERRLFVWYGENQAGEIDLEWNRGVMQLRIEPMAKSVHLTGPHHSFSLTNSAGTTASVPVGRYQVTALFDYAVEQDELRVGHNETNLFLIKPNLGSISVNTLLPGAKYRLSSQNRGAVDRQGDAPAVVAGLPVGGYQLRVWRGDYFKEMPVEVKKWETNRVEVAFEYGAVKLISDPDDATIFSGDTELGKTPITVSELKPGPYRFRLEKPGYTPTEISVEVIGTNFVTVTTNLLSVQYTEAITNARREGSGLSPDYRQALANVELALKAKPNDADALALKTELETSLRGQQAREAQQRRRVELEARMNFAAQAFEQATASVRQSELFDTHRWEFSSQLEKVRGGVLRALNRSSPNWTVEREIRVEPQTALLYCKPKGILAAGKQCMILASQVDSDTVHVHAKFWDYVLSKKVTISIFQGVTPDSLIPVHKNYFQPDQAASIEARRREIAESFRAALQNELR